MKILVATFLATLALAVCHCVSDEETAAKEYLKNLNPELIKLKNLEHEAYWTFASNITDYNERKKNEASAEFGKFMKKASDYIKSFKWQNFQSDDLKRQLRMLSKQRYTALPEQDYTEYLKTLSSMTSNFAKLRFCEYENKKSCNVSFDPEVLQITTKSRDPEKLKYYWREFYDKVGAPARSSFEKYVELNAKAAKLNGFKSAAEMWLDEYEFPTIERQVEDILKTIKPLYLQIHGYVRHRLRQHYGNDAVSETGPIPMHLLGNLWAEEWTSIADIILPFPNKPLVDVSNEMMKQNYTPLKITQMADEFLTSMGLKKAPQLFWDKSILEKPKDGRDLICHGSTWDFFYINDVRILQCTQVSQDHLLLVHHALASIQYYLQYQHQPFIYRTAASPGFYAAASEVFSLSVSTPKHLSRIGLLKNHAHKDEVRIQKLFMTALKKIVFLPYGFTVEKYRWSLFREQIDKSQWNCAFWKMREEYSGIEPPVVRTENDFDAPAKFHVSAGVEYLGYFVATIMQFQFYKSACIKAGQYDSNNPELPLDNCDVYGSLAAGESFAKMMSMGASKPWPDALEAFTGERNMSANAIIDYFEPLRVWLEAENKKNNVTIGWTTSDKCINTS